MACTAAVCSGVKDVGSMYDGVGMQFAEGRGCPLHCHAVGILLERAETKNTQYLPVECEWRKKGM